MCVLSVGLYQNYSHFPIETRVLVNYENSHDKHMRKPPHHIDDPFLD